MKKTRIVILAKYPTWRIDETLSEKSGHYAVWLTALHESFESWDDVEIHWITLCKNLRKPQVYQRRGQFFHVLPCGSRLLAQSMAYLPDRWRIKNYLNRLSPDLVHAWGTEECYGLCLMDFPGRKILSVQGVLTACAARAAIANFEKKQCRFEKRVFNSIPYITTESQWARERVQELAPHSNIHLFEYAVEREFFTAERKISEQPNCLMLSSDVPLKNIPMAIDVFSRPELRSIKLYMAGVRPGSYSNLPDNIIPLGHVGRQQVLKLLSETWCIVHPSLADTGPTAVKEARVMGVAAIATKDCGAKDYIEPGKSGFIIDSRSPQQLAEAVLAVTQSRDTAAAMGIYGQDQCRRNLSEEMMIDRLRHIYQECLSS